MSNFQSPFNLAIFLAILDTFQLGMTLEFNLILSLDGYEGQFGEKPTYQMLAHYYTKNCSK